MFTVNSVITTSQSLTHVTDLGVITSSGSLITPGAAISITGNGAAVVNAGLVTSISFCVSAAANFSLMNSGLMTTENTCINLSIANTNTTTAAITNAGQIVSTLSSAIVCAEAGLNIQNTGLISGRTYAINISSADLTATNRINNSGTIEAQATSTLDYAITCNGTLRLVNTGTILGQVNLGDGNDIVDNRAGLITGAIQLDDGDNLFFGGILGETITSGIGLDTLRSDAGDDTVSAGFGNDLVRGGAGDDVLVGSFGDDALHGGAGDDTLTGGAEADQLFGGAGKDVFVFLAPGDSDPGQSPDFIPDFNSRDDLIDLSAFAPAVFNFVGTGLLTGGGTASFGYSTVAGQLTLLADVNGDGTADFRVEVTGTKALVLADFIL